MMCANSTEGQNPIYISINLVPNLSGDLVKAGLAFHVITVFITIGCVVTWSILCCAKKYDGRTPPLVANLVLHICGGQSDRFYHICSRPCNKKLLDKIKLRLIDSTCINIQSSHFSEIK